MEQDKEDEEDLTPLQDQRVFGAGIRRTPVLFVPATSTESPPPRTNASTSKSNTGDRYLSIVLQRDLCPAKTNQFLEGFSKGLTPEVRSEEGHHSAGRFQELNHSADCHHALCDICKLPMIEQTSSERIPLLGSRSRPHHEASIAHQVCLAHSHPPSGLDRTRKGLQYLSSRGWDPDSRLGLGPSGGGIRVPIKTQTKNNTLGLGIKETTGRTRACIEKAPSLDAKQVRRREQEIKRKRGRLQELFYRDDDVQRYLGLD